MAKKEGLTERREIRLTADEQEVIQKGAELWNLSVSEFMRFVAVEMARSIIREPEKKLHAVLMGIGSVEPEVVLYSASADFTPSPSPEPEEEMKDAEE